MWSRWCWFVVVLVGLCGGYYCWSFYFYGCCRCCGCGFVGGSRFMSFALLRLLLRRFYNFALLSSSSLSAVPHAVGVAARAAPSVTLFPAIARSQTGPRVITSPSSSLTAWAISVYAPYTRVSSRGARAVQSCRASGGQAAAAAAAAAAQTSRASVQPQRMTTPLTTAKTQSIHPA